MTRILLPFAVCLALCGLAACGGGGSSPSGSGPSGTFTYVNPTGYQGDPYGFALLKDAASTNSTLILDVVGPAVPAVAGVTFAFDADTTKVAWVTTPVVTNGDRFNQVDTGLQFAQGWVAGTRLQGIVAGKGLATGAVVPNLGGGIIAKIALTPVPGASAGIVFLKDSGMGNLMGQSGPPALPVTIAVGTLTLN